MDAPGSGSSPAPADSQWRRLLELLHDNPAQAEMRWELLRKKVEERFLYNTRIDHVEVAARTMDIVARLVQQWPVDATRLKQLRESKEIEWFALGVAKRVAHEEGRKRAKEVGLEPYLDEDFHQEELEDLDYECMKYALSQLKDEQRELMNDYHPPGIPENEWPAHRRKLATQMNLKYPALRKRVQAARETLWTLYNRCCKKK